MAGCRTCYRFGGATLALGYTAYYEVGEWSIGSVKALATGAATRFDLGWTQHDCAVVSVGGRRQSVVCLPFTIKWSAMCGPLGWWLPCSPHLTLRRRLFGSPRRGSDYVWLLLLICYKTRHSQSSLHIRVSRGVSLAGKQTPK